MVKHFLDLPSISKADLRAIVDRGHRLKSGRRTDTDRPLTGKTLAMIFEKPSTRTRVSFEVGMRELGGDVVVLNAGDLQLGRGESVADTARVLSRYVDAIMLRTSGEERIAEMAEYASVPIINGLTDSSHPCQLIADVMAIEEHRGPIVGKHLAWAGDGNNVAQTFIEAAVAFDFSLSLACPEPLMPPEDKVRWARELGADVRLTHDPEAAVAGADAVITDTWVSMGDEDAASRHNLLKPYQVNADLMAKAKADAVFLHCLPAHREEEVTAEVIDGPKSIVWDEAENRLHAQKSVLLWCLSEG